MAEVVIMPKLGFDMAEGILVRWMRAEGEGIEKGEVLAEIETDKATVEVESSFSGTVLRQVVEEGAIIPVGNPIAIVGEAGEEINEAELVATVDAEAPAPAPETPEMVSPAVEAPEPVVMQVDAGDGRLPAGVKASPLARKLAADLGVNLAGLAGTGPGGRIVKRDVETAAAAPSPVGLSPQIATLSPLTTERIKMSKLRGAIGRRMTASKQQLPHFYITTDIDAAPFMEMREEYNTLLGDENKLSVNDFIVRAAALALREVPNLNASLDGEDIVRHGDINVGIAVAVPDGLLTVVVRNADQKPLPTISSEARAMIARARDGKVQPDDIEGSTFTVSNLGMFDVDHFIAIINPPEAGILAVGSVQETPIVREGRIEVGHMMKATISADHRVTDGAEAAQWIQRFKEILEHPLRLVV